MMPPNTSDSVRRGFESFEAMQGAHTELLDRLPDEDLRGEDTERVKAFLATGAATGARLDDPRDRKVAQAVLDYWRATLYAESRSLGPEQAAKDFAGQRLADAVLAHFDPAAIGEAIGAADHWLAAL